jgi:SAM-dependent methyltransferase
MNPLGTAEFRRQASSFGEDAEQYDRSRPTYPAAVVDGLLAEVGGGPVDVLDIGCGTGKLGRLFAERGCRVLGVEADARMARVARRHGLEVEVSPFERWPASGRTFRIAVAGQSWHWVDPVLGPPHLAEVLESGGIFAAVWNVGEAEPSLQAALDEVYVRFKPDEGRRGGTARSDEEREVQFLAPLRATGSFLDPVVREVPWVAEYSKAQWLDQLPTHSDHRTMEPGALATLIDAVGSVIDAHGGRLRMLMRAEMIVAHRR